MRHCFLMLCLALVLSGCHPGKRVIPARQAAVMAEMEPSVEHKRAAWMAYEHEIELEVGTGKTRSVFEAVKQTCTGLPDRACTILEANIRSGTAASATVRMRVQPDSVNKVLRALDGRGTVLNQSTRAEDLEEPIQDGARKLAMLTGYRAKLEALAAQRGLEPEALIKLHRELAEVQSQIEANSGSQAKLQQRVDTEVLTVNLSEEAGSEANNAVQSALKTFAHDFLNGVAALITFVASALPFALVGAVLYVLWRRRRRARSAAPEQR